MAPDPTSYTRQAILAPLAQRTALLLVAVVAVVAIVGPRSSGGVRLAILAVAVGLLFLVWFAYLAIMLRRHVEIPLARVGEATLAMARVDKLATTGRLAAGVAHEVGNPLSAIANYSHVVRQRAGGTPGIDEPLDALEREIERIDRIVRGLIDFARPRRKTPKSTPVEAVLNDAVRLMTDQGVLRRVTVHRDIESDGAAVYAERHDLQQVFVNLILNAVDAMSGAGTLVLRLRSVPLSAFHNAPARRSTDPEDERFPHTVSGRAVRWLARVDPQRTQAVLQIVVADSGTGVAEDDAVNVFEPFFSTKGAERGSGLGLAIVAQTIESLGGTIWTQPSREGGAAFVLLLPLHGKAEAPRSTE